MEKYVVVFSVHALIWSGFLYIMHLADHDHMKYRVVLFLVFMNIAYWLAQTILVERLKAFLITCISPAAFFAGKWLFAIFIRADLLFFHLWGK